MTRSMVTAMLAALALVATGCGSSSSTSSTIKSAAKPPSLSPATRTAIAALPVEPAGSTAVESAAYRSYVARFFEVQHHLSPAVAAKLAACDTHKIAAAGYKTVAEADKAHVKDPGKFTQIGKECGLPSS